jgi:dihydroorotate dehydrogenase (NAD+) catalytic subunit
MGHGASKIDLGVELGPLRLANPVLVASGTFGYGDELPDLTEVERLGGIVTKTVTLEPRAGNPPPRLQETPAGLLNSIGLQNVGCELFGAQVLPRLLALGPAIVVSVGGRRAEDFATCVRMLDGREPAAYEINISCPNVTSGLEYSRDPAEAARVIALVRAATKRPLFAKLSPNVTDIVAIGRACLEAGADGLTAVNTYVGMVIDVARRRPVLRRGTGGLSGPAIRPLALARVWDLCRRLGCPVMGVGGVVTAHDALEFILAGAAAVQIGTANFRDPSRGARVVEGLAAYARAQGVTRLRDLVGALECDPLD